MKSNNRYLGALMIAPFIIFIFLGGIYLKSFVILLSAMGLWEFYNALKKKDFNPISIFGYALLIMYYLLNNDFNIMMYVIVLAMFILLIIPVINLDYTFIDVSLTFLGFIYAGILFSFVYLVNAKHHGEFLVWLIFIGSWMTDTSAYYSGKFLGKHKLCPKVSPKKTIEGSIGGLLGAILFCGIFGIIVNKYVYVMPLHHYFIIGALCGIFSQFGDLVASSIKRYVGIKDYSNLIPGHGGILDRFDSIIFSSTVVFYYLTFVVVI
ncbi:phosphatidate cytidylyltransferase [Clostridium botulinum]|uniref:Phosphatidate cytidylyltransferase n=1 Tax=Clostridium botulinum TaxID=1491 RepID=A0A0L9Y864_CLOBO|nr:phosphatidate cytidylyltransferase [Clostridium botulinum]ACD54196.1 phosphatidate cytidylyltransferase [Clostridium botulinum E3 str. Alaska E43]AJF29225.1 CDP-diglyceride synthetase [Clostridium botulinum]AJF32286.1 CDP-diglyceride synthetase [Clostridium botulinum]KAI3350956.1 phosphatidate cytidylyltransferase [Clostridium botulinum]KOM87808.1 CDP-diglyceride synthetase [Clostridium botulinum]